MAKGESPSGGLSKKSKLHLQLEYKNCFRDKENGKEGIWEGLGPNPCSSLDKNVGSGIMVHRNQN